MAAEHTPLPLHKLDIETYDRIVASGALEGERVELLNGAIVDMSPQSPAHAGVIRRLTRHFAGAWLQVQSPIALPSHSEPEPDLALFAEEPSPDRHPTTALLVIEVAITSQLIDRNVKAPLYAQAGIPTYWLIDVPARTVEVRTNPGPNGYANCATYKEGELVPSPLTDTEALNIATLLAGLRA